MIIFILGRQPNIGLAELRAVFDVNAKMLSDNIAASQIDENLSEQEFIEEISTKFAQLGSVVKIAQILPNFDYKNEKDWWKILPSNGKITLGFSSYSAKISSGNLAKIGLNLKKNRSKNSGSMRLILPENHEKTLNSATIFHNKLAKNDSENKLEINFLENSGKIFVAKTIFIQDINSYSFRDFSRPRRDARVGMLPPKLAQTIINLARGANLENNSDEIARKLQGNQTLLDPFCGTGVVLQEAILMNLQTYGTDLEPRMIDYSRANLDWLNDKFHRKAETKLEIGDATNHVWSSQIDLVATETYLGRPYSAEPNEENLRENITNCNLILTKFLQNLHDQISPKVGLCIAAPCWFVRNRVIYLPLIEKINALGFEQISYLTDKKPLVYRREGQIVGRELLVLRKKSE